MRGAHTHGELSQGVRAATDSSHGHGHASDHPHVASQSRRASLVGAGSPVQATGDANFEGVVQDDYGDAEAAPGQGEEGYGLGMAESGYVGVGSDGFIGDGVGGNIGVYPGNAREHAVSTDAGVNTDEGGAAWHTMGAGLKELWDMLAGLKSYHQQMLARIVREPEFNDISEYDAGGMYLAKKDHNIGVKLRLIEEREAQCDKIEKRYHACMCVCM